MDVLLIDDAAVLRTVFTRIADALGHDVIAVGDAAEGRRRAAAQRFSAIVVDGRLAGYDIGRHVGALRAAAPHSAVFVIASLDERALVARAAAAGAVGAILRPFRRAQIRQALASLEPPPPAAAHE
ncbi:MAG: response regulator [Candidatus Eremiobacteraeota bacterium]|nr:response regulator [Candidatus Eremiobacteraeota bacterium]MBC5802057.1 response regulator [Candidatus Eremiobacteraeota bacterium]MBC5822706.1 response regulator [Candidatus Eremiobacteraeota bacterium]